MKKLAEIATSRGGKVREVGFGMGISASYIQDNEIEEHHIIEANNEVFERAYSLASSFKKKTILHSGFWEDVSCEFKDESFDGILFDTYPITLEEKREFKFLFFPEACRLLREGGVFTYFTGEVEFTQKHVDGLRKAEFTKYQGDLVSVKPPQDCLYWIENEILAPIIVK